MAIPGTLGLPGLASTPSAPPTGSYILYTKTDNTLNIEDSLGNVYTFGATTAISQLTGDVSAIGPGSAVATVNSVGGQTAAAIAAAAVAVAAATSSNVPSTLVERDSSGNFAAGIITASLNGNASTATLATNFSGSLSGDVTGTQTATSIASTVVTGKLLTGLSPGSNTPIIATNSILIALENLQAQISAASSTAITNLTGDVTANGPGSVTATVNSVGGQTAAAVAAAAVAVAAATPLDTPSTLVERDSSGNFAAGTITANLTGVASGNLIPPHNQVIVQKNPGTGQFSSVAAAIASITTASSVNPFEVQIEPGVYVEPAIAMKPYVFVTGKTAGTVILVPSSPNATFISGIDNSGMARVIISGANGINGIGLFHQGTLGQAFIAEFCVFNNCTLCVSTTATVGNPSKLDLSHCFFKGMFTTGLLATTDGASANSVLVDDLVYASQGSPYATDVIVGHGIDLLLVITNSQFIQPTGNCIRIYDGAQLLFNASSIVDFGKAIWVQNTGAAPAVSINSLQTLNNTVDIQVDHTGTTGSISGSFDAATSTISSSNLSIFTSDPTDGVTITGSITYGDTFADRTNVTELILGGPTMGVYSGGVLTSGGGLIVDVSAGSGYYSTGTPDTYLVWPNSSITLLANSTNYIYWNSSSVLTAGSTFPNTADNILLGRVVTNGTGLEFIDASPLTANHYGNLNDDFIREALGPVFAFGCITVEDATPLHLDVSSGSYFFGTTNFLPSANTGITFQTFYQNGVGGWTIGSSTIVDTNNYDNGTGTLQPIPSGQYARHTLYLVGQGINQQYLFVYAQTTYATLTLAQTGNIPNPPPYFTDGVVLIASLIVLQGSSSIVSGGGQIVDNRPRIGFSLPAVESVGSVISVALALPASVFSVTGSPVTTTGTLNGAFVNQSANSFFAGPSSGPSATPTFRSVVNSDLSAITTLPSLALPFGQVTGGTAGSIIFSNGTILAQDNANFFWNDTNFSLGIGTNTPASNAFIDAVSSTGASRTLQLTGYGVGSTVGTRGRFARGTIGSPAAAQNGDIINFWSARGYGASQFAAASTGAINAVAGETFTNASNATYLSFLTTPTGSVTSAERLRINSTGNILIGTSTDNATDLLQVSGGVISTYSKLAGAISGYFEQMVPSTVTTYSITWPGTQATAANQVPTNNGSGVLSWSAPVISSNSTLTNGDIWVGNASNVAMAQSPSGDVSMTNAGVFTVTALQGHSVSSTAPTDAQLLIYVTGTSKWTPASLGGDVNITDTGASTIQPNVVSNSKLAQAPTNTLKGNNTGVTANVTDLTVSQVNTMLGDVTTVGTYNGGTANANAAFISGNSIFFQSASTSFPGMVDTTTQSFAGNKTFTGTIAITPASTTALVIDTSAFIFDSTNVVLGIGLQPATSVMIDGLNTTGASKLVQMTGYGVGSTTGYRGRFARGTLGTPAAVQSGDILNALSGRGYGASQFAAASTGVLNVVAGETFTNASNLTYLQFSTTPTGSVTSAEAMRVASTGVTLGPQSSSTAIHQINGGLNRTTRTVTASTFTVDTTTTDDIIFTDSTSNTITITLPAPTNGRVLLIQDKTGKAGTNKITISQHAAETINGKATLVLDSNYAGVILTSDGTNWATSFTPVTSHTITASTYTVDSTNYDSIIYTDSTSNAITITLPAASNGRVLSIQDKTGQAATNHITITPPGSVLINGVNASISIGTNYSGWVLTSDGTNWIAYQVLPQVPAQAISASAIDWSTGTMFTKTLSANTTFTFANAISGQTIVIRLTNTASNYTVTWPTIKWPVQTTPVMTVGAFSDVYTIIYDGSNFYGSYVQNF